MPQRRPHHAGKIQDTSAVSVMTACACKNMHARTLSLSHTHTQTHTHSLFSSLPHSIPIRCARPRTACIICPLPPAEVLQCFLATREAMQLQQNETVYESSGTSTLPSSTESPGTPEREPPAKQWERGRTPDHALSFPAACHLLVSRCVFLLLGVRAAWQEPAEPTDLQAESETSRCVCVCVCVCVHPGHFSR